MIIFRVTDKDNNVFCIYQYQPIPVILDPEKVIDPEALSNTVRPSLDEMTQWITDDLEFAAKNAPEVAPDLGHFLYYLIGKAGSFVVVPPIIALFTREGRV